MVSIDNIIGAKLTAQGGDQYMVVVNGSSYWEMRRNIMEADLIAEFLGELQDFVKSCANVLQNEGEIESVVFEEDEYMVYLKDDSKHVLDPCHRDMVSDFLDKFGNFE